jgi:hypothetical protein
VALGAQPFYIGINDSFPAQLWLQPLRHSLHARDIQLIRFLGGAGSHEGGERRASIARGRAVFNAPSVAISGVAELNDVL